MKRTKKGQPFDSIQWDHCYKRALSGNDLFSLKFLKRDKAPETKYQDGKRTLKNVLVSDLTLMLDFCDKARLVVS